MTPDITRSLSEAEKNNKEKWYFQNNKQIQIQMTPDITHSLSEEAVKRKVAFLKEHTGVLSTVIAAHSQKNKWQLKSYLVECPSQ